jgi:hypothetical protein
MRRSLVRGLCVGKDGTAMRAELGMLTQLSLAVSAGVATRGVSYTTVARRVRIVVIVW